MTQCFLTDFEKWRTKLATDLTLRDASWPFETAVTEILGSIHERSVGELRKAKGVYYTPSYIVDYIVDKTFSRLLTSETHHQDSQPSRANVLDPACGCGAFLLGVYQYLLDSHLRWHIGRDPGDSDQGPKASMRRDEDGQWRLSFTERRRILLDSIHGVDIDARAVEITKLSLLLKMLEGETADSMNGASGMSPEISLPELSGNIQCGNSLVGHDLFLSDVGKTMSPEDRTLINAFDWHGAFPAVFRDGGFHVVIGNPPYLNGIEERTRHGDILNPYFRAKYASARGAIDASILFQELSLNCLRPGGLTSMIVPNKFLSAPFGTAFRELVAKSAEIRLLADFSKAEVFKDVATYPVVYMLEKVVPPRRQYTIDLETHDAGDQASAPSRRTSVDTVPGELATWSQIFSFGQGLLDRLARECTPLGDSYEVAASAAAAEAYAIKECLCDEEPDIPHFRFVTSGAIDRYTHTHGLTPMRYLKSTFHRPVLPADCKHLSKNRKRQYSSEKLIFAGMTKRLEAIWDSGELAGSVPTVQVLTTAASPYSLKFVLGIMNSSLINWIFNQYFSSLALSGGYLRIGVPQIRTLPLPNLDLSNPPDKSRHDKLVALVDAMILLQSRRQDIARSPDQASLDPQIAAHDYEMDKFVCKLFGITQDEQRQLAR